jgi:hypothetical protein
MNLDFKSEALEFFAQHKPDVIMAVQLIEKAMECGAELAVQHATAEINKVYEEQHQKVLKSMPQI